MCKEELGLVEGCFQRFTMKDETMKDFLNLNLNR